MLHTIFTSTLTTLVGLLTMAAVIWGGLCIAALIRGGRHD